MQLEDYSKESKAGNQSLEIESNDFIDICDEEEPGSCKDMCAKEDVANYELDKNGANKTMDLLNITMSSDADQDDQSNKRDGGSERIEERSDVHLEHSKSISDPRKEEETEKTLKTDEMQINYDENLQMENVAQTDIRALFDSDSDSESDPE